MKKEIFKKPQQKKLTRVTRSNLKDFIGSYKNILPVAVFALFLTVFVSINIRLVPRLEDLPQTGDPTSELAVETFAGNAQKFISSTEGTLFIIFFFISLLTFLVFMARSGFPRRKK